MKAITNLKNKLEVMKTQALKDLVVDLNNTLTHEANLIIEEVLNILESRLDDIEFINLCESTA